MAKLTRYILRPKHKSDKSQHKSDTPMFHVEHFTLNPASHTPLAI